MQLTTKDLSRLLNVGERTIHRWIKEGHIPHYKILDQYRFNRSEIVEWAASHNIAIPPGALLSAEDAATGASARVELSACLRRGGVHYRVEAASKRGALEAAVQRMDAPPGVSKDLLLRLLLAREELESTGLGEGIAIPHPRNPLALKPEHAAVPLFFMERPVEFDSVDGRPVEFMFILLSPSPKEHLHLLSRLVYLLRDDGVRSLLRARAPRDALFDAFQAAEARLPAKA